jgi:preprotein translocase subunit SecF
MRIVSFSKYWKLYCLISTIAISFGFFSIFTFGYRYSIDFTGGSEILYTIKNGDFRITENDIKSAVSKQSAQYVSANISKSNLYIRAVSLDEKDEVLLRQEIADKNGVGQISLDRFDEVGPTVATDMIRKTVTALLIGIIAILIYIFYVFKKVSFAIAAVVALVHDLAVVFGAYSVISYFFGAKLDTLFVTAILTTMSFSVHDTIVIFDKIREYRKSVEINDIWSLADRAVSSTMIRSINNSLTIFFMLTALVLLGGESIRFFAVALLVGTVTGAYSSPFVAVPILLGIESYLARGRRPLVINL